MRRQFVKVSEIHHILTIPTVFENPTKKVHFYSIHFCIKISMNFRANNQHFLTSYSLVIFNHKLVEVNTMQIFGAKIQINLI